MDEELKQLAALALRNAFWSDFSALVNKYLEAAAGLDTDAQERLMGERTSVYGRDTTSEDVDLSLNLWTQNARGKFDTTGHETLLEALEHEQANEVHLRGRKVFERRDGEWYFTG